MGICTDIVYNYSNDCNRGNGQSRSSFSSRYSNSRPDFGDLTEKLFDEDISNVAAWAAVICSVLGCVGNSLTILVLLCKPTLRKHSTTPFLLSLAFSDLCFSAFNLPLTAARFFMRCWPFRYCTCQLFPFFFYANICISAFSMALIALNRYVGVFHSHQMKTIFSWTKSCLMIFVLWIFSFGMMLVPWTKTWGQLGYDSQIFSCTVKDLYDKNPLTTFLAIGNGIPLIIISYCYVSVYCKVKKTHNDLQDIMDGDVVDSNLSRQMAEREAAITKMTLMVWTGFCVCFLPTSLIMIIDPMPPNRNNPEVHVAGYILFWCSAFINPIIYTACNQNYRRALVEMLCCRAPYEEVSTTVPYGYDPSNSASRSTSFLSMSSFRSSKRRFRRSDLNYDVKNEDGVEGIAMQPRI